ncbi:MAG TPA: phosphoadenylyl-sulfate reductase [Polyangiales bacterium]|nr:phosphoadenylyl-sulfate reductase [Polyangiales bacterium]
MHVTMVKKQLAGGAPCRKCAEAEELIKGRGLWGRIDKVVWAIEGQPASEGFQLGARYGVETAPFFVVRDESGREQVIESTLRLLRALTPIENVHADEGAIDFAALESQVAAADAPEIVRIALERFGDSCAIAFSGSEDVALIDMAAHSGQAFSVFCLDTGRLHPETYRFIDRVRKHYAIEIELQSPDPQLLQPFVHKKGLFSFYEDGHSECCSIRKVEPLKRMLAQKRAWMTGQRKDQSPNTRAHVPLLQEDRSHAGATRAPLIKWNPLANWSSVQVWRYIREHGVPYNELHERGFISIGCEPCTRAIVPGQHEREGRWWWEEATKKECGLHSGEQSA